MIGSGKHRGTRHARTLAIALIVLVVPAVAAADTTKPVDVAISSHQPKTVGLGETFLFGVTVGTNPNGYMDPERFPESWSLTWAVTFPTGLTMVSAGWTGLSATKLPNCAANCVYVMNTPASRGYEYRVKATSLGTKILHARITAASNPDPYATNDAAAARMPSTSSRSDNCHSNARVNGSPTSLVRSWYR